MTTLTFNLLDATKRLREAGFDEKQAETVVRVMSEYQDQLVTREYLNGRLEALELRLTIKLGGLMTILSGIILAVMRLPH